MEGCRGGKRNRTDKGWHDYISSTKIRFKFLLGLGELVECLIRLQLTLPLSNKEFLSKETSHYEFHLVNFIIIIKQIILSWKKYYIKLFVQFHRRSLMIISPLKKNNYHTLATLSTIWYWYLLTQNKLGYLLKHLWKSRKDIV